MALDARQTANLLGLAGLLPFVALAAAVVLLPDWRGRAAFALATYGATILSFLGAIHWGFAITPTATRAPRNMLLVAGLAPFFVGWGALLVPLRPGLLVLSVGIVGALALDRLAVDHGAAPAWWWPLRLRLSAGAGACLAVAGLFAP